MPIIWILYLYEQEYEDPWFFFLLSRKESARKNVWVNTDVVILVTLIVSLIGIFFLRSWVRAS